MDTREGAAEQKILLTIISKNPRKKIWNLAKPTPYLKLNLDYLQRMQIKRVNRRNDFTSDGIHDSLLLVWRDCSEEKVQESMCHLRYSLSYTPMNYFNSKHYAATGKSLIS